MFPWRTSLLIFRWVLVCIEKYSYLCKVLIIKKEECGYSREF